MSRINFLWCSMDNSAFEKYFLLLLAPVFIGSTHISSEGKILLFFTEVGDLFGDSFVKSLTVTRVAQVCTVRCFLIRNQYQAFLVRESSSTREKLQACK